MAILRDQFDNPDRLHRETSAVQAISNSRGFQKSLFVYLGLSVLLRLEALGL